MLVLLVGTGLYLTVSLRFFSFRNWVRAYKCLWEGRKHQSEHGEVSPWNALMTALAADIGTGNIVGISTAICCGGAGAVFWMWVIALIGGASAFVESTLAQIYKRRAPDGSCYGGPAYYIEAALHSRPLAVVFAVALVLTYAGGFNMLASYNLQSTFSAYSFYDPAVSPPGSSALCWRYWWDTASWAVESASSASPPLWCPSWVDCMCWWRRW